MVDLRKCKPGDKLLSKHGMILEYVRYEPTMAYPHIVSYPEPGLGNGSRTDDGHVMKFNRLSSDHDIIEILKD